MPPPDTKLTVPGEAPPTVPDAELTDPEMPGLWSPPEVLDFDLLAASGGRLEHRNEIGTGGISRILLAYDRELEREVAVKILVAGNDDETARDRFLREVKITAMLEHPGIVPVYDLGHAPGGRHFFTMPVFRGTTLREQLSRGREHRMMNRGVLVTHWLHTLVRVCEAVGYAHDQGILHLDLKPNNIMLGEHGETMVLDWGAAKRLGELPTEPPPDGEKARLAGTPGFMSPEQLNGRLHELTPAADVFSLGVILYEILTGQKPVRGYASSLLPVADAARDNQVDRVPPELAAICEKSLARDPAKRYPNAKALAFDLQAYLEHRAVTAFQAGPILRLRRWRRRHRSLGATLLTLAFTGCFALITAGVFWLHGRAYFQSLEQDLEAARNEHNEIQQRYEWTLMRLGQQADQDPQYRENLSENLRRLELERYLTGQRLQMSLSAILAARHGRHSLELGRELRALWLEEMRLIRRRGDVAAVRQAYVQMMERQAKVPWWRWEPDEYPALHELRTWLNANGGIPLPKPAEPKN